MKKVTINVNTTIEVELRNGAMWLHAADWGCKDNGWEPTLVGLSWSASCEWFPARWMVYKSKGAETEYCETFPTLSEAFKVFKLLMYLEKKGDLDITSEDLNEWEQASVGLA